MISGDPPDMLNAQQAATRLGVKRATIYAYVSRGVLSRTLSLDGKTSLFDPNEVDGLRQRHRREIRGELATVVATSVTNVTDGRVEIRGQDLCTVVAGGGSFEDCCDILFQTQSPRPWPAPQAAPPIDFVPLPSPADHIRLAVVAAAASDPLKFDPRPEQVWERTRRLIRTMAASPGSPVQEWPDTVAGTLWQALSARPATPAEIRALDTALGLLSDHGLAASTFAVRVAASVRADPYSAVLAGLGVLGGRLHGAASQAVHELLDAAAERSPEAAIGEALAQNECIPGTGHIIHQTGDPRWPVLFDAIGAAWHSHPKWDTASQSAKLIADQPGGANIDLGLGLLTWLGELGSNSGEAVFAVARTAGWIAHAAEEAQERPGRFRPQARPAGR